MTILHLEEIGYLRRGREADRGQLVLLIRLTNEGYDLMSGGGEGFAAIAEPMRPRPMSSTSACRAGRVSCA